MSGDGGLAAVLAVFDRPRSPEEALGRLPPESHRGDRRRIALLCRYGLLLSADEARRKHSRIRAWKGNVASALHHAAARDLQYLWEYQAVEEFVRKRVFSRRRPALFKRYGNLARIDLPATRSAGADLEMTLENRRTVREFSRQPVTIADLAAVVGGTWGQTGYLTGGLFGSLMTKTSPSAGALHPIECYESPGTCGVWTRVSTTTTSVRTSCAVCDAGASGRRPCGRPPANHSWGARPFSAS